MSVDFRISSSPLLYTHVSVVIIHEDLLFPTPTDDLFNYSAKCEWSTCGAVEAWPNFPGLKVGTLYLYSSFLTIG